MKNIRAYHIAENLGIDPVTLISRNKIASFASISLGSRTARWPSALLLHRAADVRVCYILSAFLAESSPRLCIETRERGADPSTQCAREVFCQLVVVYLGHNLSLGFLL